jgi:tRNA(fMet)-specific endonuclease VapC
MSVVLVDTNIVSFLFRQDTRMELYLPVLFNKEQAISFMVRAELYQWGEIHRWGIKQRANLEQTLTNYTQLPFQMGMCPLWGQLRAEARRKGLIISAEDAWIAATALYYDLPLVTHNRKDFAAVPDLQLISFA